MEERRGGFCCQPRDHRIVRAIECRSLDATARSIPLRPLRLLLREFLRRPWMSALMAYFLFGYPSFDD